MRPAVNLYAPCPACAERAAHEAEQAKLSAYTSQGKELRRDYMDAERLARRWPGVPPEQIARLARDEHAAINRKWQAEMREAGLL